MNGRLIMRSAGLLYLVAVMIMMARVGRPDEFTDWLALAPFLAWAVSPIWGGLYFSSTLKNDAAKLPCGFLVAVIALIGFAAQWHDLFIAPPDAQSALALLFGPLYQWFGVLVSIGLASLVGRAIEGKQ